MAWIQSYQQIVNHPKTLRLASLLDCTLNETIGMLHRFWWWCVDYAEDGDLRQHNDELLATAVGLNGGRGKQFVDAMVEAGWLDRQPYFRVHDWWDHAGYFLQRRYSDKSKKKWKLVKRLYTKCTSTYQISDNYPSQQNRTEQNRTEQRKERKDGDRTRENIAAFFTVHWPQETAQAAMFFDHYETTGWRTHHGPIRNWQAAARNWMRRKEEFERRDRKAVSPHTQNDPIAKLQIAYNRDHTAA